MKDGLTKEEADIEETNFIKLYNTVEDGYNLSAGGNSKEEISESTREKLSKKSLQLWEDEEYR